jgi:hypothetical protein
MDKKEEEWQMKLPPECSREIKLTKLDSSGDAKLNNNTLTFTVKVPEK